MITHVATTHSLTLTHTQCAKVTAVGLRTRDRNLQGSVAYGDLALLPQALVRCAASAGGVYEMTQSVGAAGCYSSTGCCFVAG